jgi:hypothetical protein
MRSNGWIRWIAVTATAAFVWTLVVGALPVLHERLHADQSHADHSCAVTFLRSGSYHHAAAPTLAPSAASTGEFARIVILSPCWVPSLFFAAAIFEHGPPAVS